MSTNEQAYAAEQFADENVVALSQEVLDWDNNGTLADGKMRHLQRLCAAYTGAHNALTVAKSLVYTAAMKKVAQQDQ